MPTPLLLEAPPGHVRTLVLARLAAEAVEGGARVLWLGSQTMVRPLAWLPLDELRLDARAARPPFGPAQWPAIGTADESDGSIRRRLVTTRDRQLIVVSGHPRDLVSREGEVVELLRLFVEEALATPEEPVLVVVEDWMWTLRGPSESSVVPLLIDLATICPRSFVLAAHQEVPRLISDLSTRIVTSSPDEGEDTHFDPRVLDRLEYAEQLTSPEAPVVAVFSPMGSGDVFCSPTPIESDDAFRRVVI